MLFLVRKFFHALRIEEIQNCKRYKVVGISKGIKFTGWKSLGVRLKNYGCLQVEEIFLQQCQKVKVSFFYNVYACSYVLFECI